MSDRKQPLITVIIAIYNGEKYLDACLKSVIGQDYINLEIILIDDGSEDSSGKIADNYAEQDGRVKVIHQENVGVSASRNCGLEHARGKYICIIDQDDSISADYISYFYNLIREYNAEISYTPSADKFFKRIHSKKVTEKAFNSTGIKAAEEMLYHKIVIAPWNKMISKDLIDNNHIRFQTDFFGGEGFAFSMECFQCAKRVAVGNRQVYHYRVGDPESGASRFRISTIYSSINAQQYIRKIVVDKNEKLMKAWKFSNWHTCCDCLNMMVGCGAVKNYKVEYNKLKHICQEQALCALESPVSMQQKFRGILFKINPYFAAKVINYFRVRKFEKG